MSSTKNPKSKAQFFFSFYITRLHESLEGLNSSLAHFAAKVWLPKVCLQMAILPFVKLFIFRKLSFLAIIFAPDVLERYAPDMLIVTIRGSKDSYDSLDFKKILFEKIGSLGWRRGPGKIRRKGKNTPFMTYPTGATRPQKKRNFFQSQLEDLLNS